VHQLEPMSAPEPACTNARYLFFVAVQSKKCSKGRSVHNPVIFSIQIKLQDCDVVREHSIIIEVISGANRKIGVRGTSGWDRRNSTGNVS
jgi:transcription initiation factor TFIIIB Brf1 subunit/transcription initiation factor TFIIB